MLSPYGFLAKLNTYTIDSSGPCATSPNFRSSGSYPIPLGLSQQAVTRTYYMDSHLHVSREQAAIYLHQGSVVVVDVAFSHYDRRSAAAEEPEDR